jgi:hypothetical protein
MCVHAWSATEQLPCACPEAGFGDDDDDDEACTSVNLSPDLATTTTKHARLSTCCV